MAQGYLISDAEIEMTIEDFKASYADPLTGVVDRAKICFAADRRADDEALTENTERIYIFYARDKSVGIKVMRECVCTSASPLIAQLHRGPRQPEDPGRATRACRQHDLGGHKAHPGCAQVNVPSLTETGISHEVSRARPVSTTTDARSIRFSTSQNLSCWSTSQSTSSCRSTKS